MGPWLGPTVAAGAALAGIAALLGPLGWLAAGGVTALVTLITFDALALPLLVVASAVDRLGVSISGSQLRPDMLVVVLLAAVLLNRALVRLGPERLMRWPLLAPLTAYLAVNVLATVLFATEKARGLRLDVEIASVVMAYAVALALMTSSAQRERALRLIWWVTVAEALFGLACMAAYQVHLTGFGVQLGDYGLPMAYGTQYEANIFGSFLLGNFFLVLGDYARNARSAPKAFGLLIVVAGIAVSMTRTVWLALLFGLLVFVAIQAGRRSESSRLLPVLLGVGVLILGGFLLGAATPFGSRLFNVVNLQSSSAIGRAAIFRAALADWHTHPLLGLGTGSFNFGAAAGQPHPWLPNLLLLTLHDTGVIGLAVLIWLFVGFYRGTMPTARSSHPWSPVVAGSVAGFTALLVAFQTTSGFWFVYPWIVAAVGISVALTQEAPA